MLTLFEGIPDAFVEHYDAQFCEWARNFRVRGKTAAIVFDILPGDVPTMGVNGELPWKGAWLMAAVETHRGRPTMVVRPASDWDKNLIEVHCWHLAKRK